jgi:hypothetical protein
MYKFIVAKSKVKTGCSLEECSEEIAAQGWADAE